LGGCRAAGQWPRAQTGPLGWQQQGRSGRVSGGGSAKVRRRFGGALWEAQIGRKAPYAKALKGFGDAGVLEIVDDFDGDAFRAVYTVRFPQAVYVLHAFQKKSKRGVTTPKAELNLIDQRLKRAKEDYEQWSKKEPPKFL
jgi:phage-related protein